MSKFSVGDDRVFTDNKDLKSVRALCNEKFFINLPTEYTNKLSPDYFSEKEIALYAQRDHNNYYSTPLNKRYNKPLYDYDWKKINFTFEKSVKMQSGAEASENVNQFLSKVFNTAKIPLDRDFNKKNEAWTPFPLENISDAYMFIYGYEQTANVSYFGGSIFNFTPALTYTKKEQANKHHLNAKGKYEDEYGRPTFYESGQYYHYLYGKPSDTKIDINLFFRDYAAFLRELPRFNLSFRRYAYFVEREKYNMLLYNQKNITKCTDFSEWIVKYKFAYGVNRPFLYEIAKINIYVAGNLIDGFDKSTNKITLKDRAYTFKEALLYDRYLTKPFFNTTVTAGTPEKTKKYNDVKENTGEQSETIITKSAESNVVIINGNAGSVFFHNYFEYDRVNFVISLNNKAKKDFSKKDIEYWENILKEINAALKNKKLSIKGPSYDTGDPYINYFSKYFRGGIENFIYDGIVVKEKGNDENYSKAVSGVLDEKDVVYKNFKKYGNYECVVTQTLNKTSEKKFELEIKMPGVKILSFGIGFFDYKIDKLQKNKRYKIGRYVFELKNDSIVFYDNYPDKIIINETEIAIKPNTSLTLGIDKDISPKDTPSSISETEVDLNLITSYDCYDGREKYFIANSDNAINLKINGGYVEIKKTIDPKGQRGDIEW